MYYSKRNESRMIKDNSNPTPTVEDIVTRVRKNVCDLLECGATAPDLSFALAFVATELGLQVSRDGVAVFPVLLRGIAAAATANIKAAGPDGVDAVDGIDSSPPAGTSLH
jgi:hypothetical protein